MTASALRVEGLQKVYGRGAERVVAIDDVGFTVSPGEVVGLLGHNGAGKTTTMKCICSLVRPTGGAVSLGGIDALAHPRQALARLAAVLEGNRNLLMRLTTRENLEFFAGLHGFFPWTVRNDIDALLERFDLTARSHNIAQTLSRGMQQKLAIACALVKRTEFLLLDEPTLGLDVETSLELRSALRDLAEREGRALLLSSHDLDVVEAVCDRVVIIHRGRVVTDDSIANLLKLFQARAYEFTILGRLSADLEESLRRRFAHARVAVEAETTRIDVEFLASRDFYEFVELLRRNDAALESVDRKTPDLEEVFLSIVQEGNDS